MTIVLYEVRESLKPLYSAYMCICGDDYVCCFWIIYVYEFAWNLCRC